MKTFKILFAAVLFAGFTTNAFAQVTEEATINANATVLQSAELTAEKDLEFGDVTIGATKAILASADEAGHFILTTNAAGLLTFDLPENLTATIDGQLRELPISFNNDEYGRVVGLDNAGDQLVVDFNPASPYNLETAAFDHANVFNIYLGGIVSPAVNQHAGAYTAEVTLTVELN